MIKNTLTAFPNLAGATKAPKGHFFNKTCNTNSIDNEHAPDFRKSGFWTGSNRPSHCGGRGLMRRPLGHLIDSFVWLLATDAGTGIRIALGADATWQRQGRLRGQEHSIVSVLAACLPCGYSLASLSCAHAHAYACAHAHAHKRKHRCTQAHTDAKAHNHGHFGK